MTWLAASPTVRRRSLKERPYAPRRSFGRRVRARGESLDDEQGRPSDLRGARRHQVPATRDRLRRGKSPDGLEVQAFKGNGHRSRQCFEGRCESDSEVVEILGPPGDHDEHRLRGKAVGEPDEGLP